MNAALIKLLILAVLSGVAWRAELEWRGGWAGLTWITYFHWAIPVCGLAFIAWVVGLKLVKHPGMFAAALVGFFSLSFVFFDQAARLCYSRWVVLPGLMEALLWATPVFWAMIPIFFGVICHVFGVRLGWWRLGISSALFVMSWPLAMVILDLTGHRGGADVIHALKSGFVIPLLIVSLGYPLLHRPTKH